MINFSALTINKRIAIKKNSALALILIVSTVIVLDTTIVKFVAFSRDLPISFEIGIFTIFAMIISFTSFILMKYVKDSETTREQKSTLRYFSTIIMFSQYSIIAILASIIFQMIFLKNYNILFLLSVIILAHISALSLLVSLVYILVSWFRSKKNYAILLYAISFSLISISMLTSLIYLTIMISFRPLLIKPFSMQMFLVNLPRSDLTNTFGPFLDVLTLVSFVLTWIATCLLLSQYRHRIGKLRYLIIICIPLIYFLFPFERHFANIFSQFMLASPVMFGVVYLAAFSATKQAAGILFAMAFMTASDLIKRPLLRNSLLITSVGMAIIFGSIEIETLIYAVYPPFGLVTVSFMPLGSYLLFIGIIISARRVAEDAALRKEFYKKAENQLSLLNSIGVNEMERQLIKRYKPVLDQSKMMEKAEDLQPEQQDVKNMVRDVLNEIQSRQGDKVKAKSKQR
jgi:hypothetical protein